MGKRNSKPVFCRAKKLQTVYGQTQEGNGQRWLMIDQEDKGRLYDDILKLIRIRRNS
ncbi:MAG: hypothetical protein HFI89_05485 [Lachnospiraceae bacterium]|nr:hypothetical protein [Lachnospiraceae bacterium]